jgi:hypothetical protein
MYFLTVEPSCSSLAREIHEWIPKREDFSQIDHAHGPVVKELDAVLKIFTPRDNRVLNTDAERRKEKNLLVGMS